jgi:hypothetical protein
MPSNTLKRIARDTKYVLIVPFLPKEETSTNLY